MQQQAPRHLVWVEIRKILTVGCLSEFRSFGGFRLPTHVKAGNYFGTDQYFPFFVPDINDVGFTHGQIHRVICWWCSGAGLARGRGPDSPEVAIANIACRFKKMR
ncbi:MAG: hypothetical protein ACOCVV_04840 [Marinobacter sp.]